MECARLDLQSSGGGGPLPVDGAAKGFSGSSPSAPDNVPYDRVAVPQLLSAATILFASDPAISSRLLSQLARSGRKLYVFQNGPIDASLDAQLSTLENLVLIRSAENIGIGAALNAILDRSVRDGCEHVLLLDQDASVGPDVPEKLLRSFLDLTAKGRRVAAIGPLLVPPADSKYWPISYSWRGKDGGVDFLPTSGSVVSLQAWRQVGPFRADYFVGAIDVEWGFRARSQGYELLVEKNLKIPHRWGPEIGSKGAWRPQILRQSDERNYYHIRNSIDCLKLPHIPRRWKLRHAAAMAAQIAVLSLSKAASLQMPHSALLAIRDGVTGRLGKSPEQRP